MSLDPIELYGGTDILRAYRSPIEPNTNISTLFNRDPDQVSLFEDNGISNLMSHGEVFDNPVNEEENLYENLVPHVMQNTIPEMAPKKRALPPLPEEKPLLMSEKKGRSRSGLAEFSPTAALIMAGGHALQGMFTMTGGLVSTSMRDSTMSSMQQQRDATEESVASMRDTTSLQLQTNQFTDQQQLINQSYNNSVNYYNMTMGNEQAALESAGLPSYLAYMPQFVKYEPDMTQITPAGTSYTSKMPGNASSVPYTGTPVQVQMGYGNVSTGS